METQTPAAIENAAPQQPELSADGGNTAPQQQEAAFDPNNLAPELQPIYKKMEQSFSDKYKGYEDYQKKAQSFDDALKDPSFVQWYNNRMNPQPAKAEKVHEVEELSADQFANLLNDPKEFSKYINDRVNALAEQKMAPKIAETQQQVEVMRRTSEIDNFAKAHDDFWALDEKGLIEPLMRKYPKADLEDIWKIARHDLVKKDAINAAHGIVRNKQAATTERPGVSTAQTAGSVKVKNRSEAMMLAAEYHRAGRQMPDFVFESTK